MAAGLGFKTFTTGEVLTAADVNGYLMQGVLVFASAAARDAAITSPQEGQCCYLKDTDAVLTYSGSAWVGFDDSNAIQNAIVDAKGDLIAASAADTPARLAVGSNGETLLADSAATTGLRWAGNYAAGKNKIINGDFGIWQRGTSFNVSTGVTYTADRFAVNRNGSGATVTVSQQAMTPGSPIAGTEGKFFWRFNQSVAGSGSTFSVINHAIEDVQTFAGQTITISFWAKADAARTLTLLPFQYFGVGGSSNANPGSQSVTLTTSWARYSLTYTMGSLSGKTIGTGSYFGFEIGLPLNTTQTIDLWGFQAETGSVATAFQTATGTLAGEYELAKRYFEFIGNGGTAGGGMICNSFVVDANNQSGVFTYTEKRVVPSFVLGAASNFLGAGSVATSVSVGRPSVKAARLDVTTTGSPFTTGQGSAIRFADSSTAGISISAEL